MTKAAKVFFGLYAAGSLLALFLSHAQATTEDRRQESIKGYKDWFLVTEDLVYMEPQVAVLCRPASEQRSPNPHVPTYFRVFVNSAGKKAMTSREPVVFPVGTVIVKEKFKATSPKMRQKPKLEPGAKAELLTVMVKRGKGFDASNGDWEYFTCNGSGIPHGQDLSVKHCQSCHQSRKDQDFVYKSYHLF